ncbi:MAG TPA: L-threonylcarbamoyladenylate synthase [Saprospiraceae bacterium]|nr:L-threonylcarbamoyladenylate synthase [Saprospiraceae bacterium]
MYLNDDNLENISNLLEQGGVILYPTDTIWGLGCDATNIEAIEKIIHIKERSPEKGFVLLVDSLEMLKNFVKYIHPKIETLLSYHNRPLTVIYPDPKNLPTKVFAPDGSAGIRITKDEFCKELIWGLGKPIISTSANLTGEAFPANFGEINSLIIQQVDYVVKYRQNDHRAHEPSVIVKMSGKKELEFLR